MAKKTVKQDLIERAVEHEKTYGRHTESFANYKLGVVLTKLVSKMGVAFVANEIVIYNPRVDMLPLSHERFHDVWSSSNKIDTKTNVKNVREINDRPISFYQEMIIKLTGCNAVEAMVVEGYMRDTYRTLDNIDRATFNREAKKALKDARLDPQTAANSLTPIPVIPTEEEDVERLLKKEAAIVERFQHASVEHDLASKAIEEHFLPLMKAAIEKGDIEAARKIQKKMPSDSVPFVFGLDMILQAEIKLGLRKEGQPVAG